jgi:hypothetical protein
MRASSRNCVMAVTYLVRVRVRARARVRVRAP